MTDTNIPTDAHDHDRANADVTSSQADPAVPSAVRSTPPQQPGADPATGSAVVLADPPIVFPSEIADMVCKQLSEGRSLRDICSDPRMPDRQTIRQWLVDDVEGFKARYRSAREMGYQAMADELLDIADNALQPDQVPSARLRIDVRKWLLSVAMPKVYGDRIDVHATYKPRDTLAELMKKIDGKSRGMPGNDERDD